MKSKTLPNSSLPTLAVTIAIALAASVAVPARATPIEADPAATVASATSLHPGDAFTGVLVHTQPMHIALALKVRNADQLSSLVAAHQTMTPVQFSIQHAPTLTQAQAVAGYLKQMGFTNVVIAPNRLLVTADGTAGTAQAAFQTSFSRVLTYDGRTAYANTSDAHVPAALQGIVLSVVGLQSANRAQTFARRAQVNANGGIASITAHNPLDFSPIYGGANVQTGAGISIGIVTEGDMSQSISDLNSFTTANSLNTVATQVIYTAPDSGDNSNNAEWSIDSQDIVGAAGGAVGQLIFYVAPALTNAGLIGTFNAAVAANVAKVINVSIGECETSAKLDGTAAAADQIFQAAVAQGQTFSIASGDSGANLCETGIPTPSWPASSPYVVAVGGTTLDASTTTWGSETVWVDAGGAPSGFEPKPTWQNALVSGTKRGVPDIAMDADPNSGALVYVNGAVEQWGGTSLASPIFVGLWARMIALKSTSIGFAAPQLYQLPTSALHDVTVGNNGGESAKSGYDFASGRGSVILSALVNDVGRANPLAASFSESSAVLTAKFTDTSTDSAGTITSHAWNFGDGGTSTAANPSHVFSKTGSYSVTETVSDTSGYTIAQTATVEITR